MLLIDNNGLDSNQLDVIGTLLNTISPSLHELRYITVNSLLGNEGEAMQWLEGPCGINILDIPVGGFVGNEFPSDVDVRYSDVFSTVVAHEVNHQVDYYFSVLEGNAALTNRRDALIAGAGDYHMNYLRSMFEDGYFSTYPQEFFASIACQWFVDSKHTLELAMVRWANGYHEPINQFLFFAEVYSEGGDEVPFYTINELGDLTHTRVPVMRNSNGHINGLIVDNLKYSFVLDSAGNVLDVSVVDNGAISPGIMMLLLE